MKRSRLLVVGVALAGALVLFPSAGAAYIAPTLVALTATGPSPSGLKTYATDLLIFDNQDSVTHTVVFANGRCTLPVAPGQEIGPGGSQVLQGGQQPAPTPAGCPHDFTAYAGSYAYTVDASSRGTIDVRLDRRTVTLTAPSHDVRLGARLTLHGEVHFGGDFGQMVLRAPFPVAIYARHGSRPYRRIALLPASGHTGYFWHLTVRPGARTTYVAELKGQGNARGKIWSNAKSSPFTVRVAS